MPWLRDAGAASSIVPVSRFVGPHIFATKPGGYGCLFSLEGIDEEGLIDQELESRVRGIEGVSYDPKRLKGVNVYRETPREIAVGERNLKESVIAAEGSGDVGDARLHRRLQGADRGADRARAAAVVCGGFVAQRPPNRQRSNPRWSSRGSSCMLRVWDGDDKDGGERSEAN